MTLWFRATQAAACGQTATTDCELACGQTASCERLMRVWPHVCPGLSHLPRSLAKLKRRHLLRQLSAGLRPVRRQAKRPPLLRNRSAPFGCTGSPRRRRQTPSRRRQNIRTMEPQPHSIPMCAPGGTSGSIEAIPLCTGRSKLLRQRRRSPRRHWTRSLTARSRRPATAPMTGLTPHPHCATPLTATKQAPCDHLGSA